MKNRLTDTRKQNVGNKIQDRNSINLTELFFKYESGNQMKDALGFTQNLKWDEKYNKIKITDVQQNKDENDNQKVFKEKKDELSRDEKLQIIKQHKQNKNDKKYNVQIFFQNNEKRQQYIYPKDQGYNILKYISE